MIQFVLETERATMTTSGRRTRSEWKQSCTAFFLNLLPSRRRDFLNNEASYYDHFNNQSVACGVHYVVTMRPALLPLSLTSAVSGHTPLSEALPSPRRISALHVDSRPLPKPAPPL